MPGSQESGYTATHKAGTSNASLFTRFSISLSSLKNPNVESHPPFSQSCRIIQRKRSLQLIKQNAPAKAERSH
jgi:hypothetical protein